jgi:hypothetical protein
LDQLISLIIFTIPGLLVYFWIQAFGLNPVVKHTPTELAAIAALFWLPTVFLMIAAYDIIFLLVDLLLKGIGLDFSGLKLRLLTSLADIQELSTNLLFLFYFFVLSLTFSLFVAFMWVKIYDKYILKMINEYRVNRKLTKLSDTTSVWDAFFHKLTKTEEEPLVVEIYKIDKAEEKIVGSITKMSRPYETERSLVLDHTSDWTEALKYYDFKRGKSYIDTKSGMVVVEINKDEFVEKTISSEGASEEVEQQGDLLNVVENREQKD